ncbi:MAG: NAD(P)/FAD-dependent oxidoreductase, partial [Endozoicomonas sp.]
MIHNTGTDIIIIGAGIAGAGLAAMLDARLKVIILEAEEYPGYHSTGRSAAVLIQNYGNPVIRQLTRLSRPYLESPPQELSQRSLLHRRGCLFLGTETTCSDIDELLKQAEGLVEVSIETALELIPALKQEKILKATYEASASDIDVAALHQGWLAMAKARGVILQLRQPVSRIEKTGKSWLVTTASEAFSAPIIVNASGAWADTIASMAGIRALGITPKRRTIAVMPAPSTYTINNWPMFGNINNTWYGKPETGRLLVSPADEDPVAPQDVHVDDRVLAEGLYRFEQAVNFPVARVERSWAGLRCFAPDETPVVGFAPEAEGFFWLAG